MTHEQLARAAAMALLDHDAAPVLAGGMNYTANFNPYWERAVAVLDAILPQVTTVEELEALPPETYLIGKALTGRPHFWRRREMDFLDAHLRAFGPFTVWRP